MRNFIINGKTLPIKVAAMDNQILIKVLSCLNEKLLTASSTKNKSELFEFLLDKFIKSDSTTPAELEKIILNINPDLLGKENFITFNLNKIIINNIIAIANIKWLNKEENLSISLSLNPDKIKILVNHIVKFGNENDFNKLWEIENLDDNIHKLVAKQLLEYSSLELAVKHENFSMIDAIVQHILVHSKVQEVKHLLHIAASNMKEYVFNEKIMQEDNFQKFSKYFQEKLESGELLTNILQSNRENNLEVVKTLVGYGTTIKAEHYKLAANSKNWLCFRICVCAVAKL